MAHPFTPILFSFHATGVCRLLRRRRFGFIWEHCQPLGRCLPLSQPARFHRSFTICVSVQTMRKWERLKLEQEYTVFFYSVGMALLLCSLGFTAHLSSVVFTYDGVDIFLGGRTISRMAHSCPSVFVWDKFHQQPLSLWTPAVYHRRNFYWLFLNLVHIYVAGSVFPPQILCGPHNFLVVKFGLGQS